MVCTFVARCIVNICNCKYASVSCHGVMYFGVLCWPWCVMDFVWVLFCALGDCFMWGDRVFIADGLVGLGSLVALFY